MAITRQDLINLLIEVRPILEDKKALQYMEMYPLWQSDLSVKVNERYQYNGRLYKVAQAHTTQADWTPDITPALNTPPLIKTLSAVSDAALVSPVKELLFSISQFTQT